MINNNKNYFGVTLLVLTSVFLFFGALYLTFKLPFYKTVSLEILTASISDYILTLFVFILSFYLYRSKITVIFNSFDDNYKKIIESLWPIFFLAAIFMAYMIYGRVELIIGGATREILVFEQSTGSGLALQHSIC